MPWNYGKNPRLELPKFPIFGKTAALVGIGESVPAGKRRGVLIDRCRRYPSAAVPVPLSVSSGAAGRPRASGTESRSHRYAVEITAGDRSADDEHMVAPGVVGADTGSGARRDKCAAEIRKREERHVVLRTLSRHLVVKRADRLAELLQ